MIEMGSAALIASAIALILLIITAYVIVGGTLATAEIVTLAQNEHIQNQETRMRTSISIVGTSLSGGGSPLLIQLENNGNEPVIDLDNMDVYLSFGDSPVFHPKGTGSGTWQVVGISPDNVHPGQLDPDEVMNLSVQYSSVISPIWVKVATGNGVYDSSYVG